MSTMDGFLPGARCEVISVHHPCFADDIGKRVVITEVMEDSRQVWAYEDKPVTYKVNRAGYSVVDRDPRGVLTLYSVDQLSLLPSWAL